MSKSTTTGVVPVREQLRSYVPHEHEELHLYARCVRDHKPVPSVVIVRPTTERRT